MQLLTESNIVVWSQTIMGDIKYRADKSFFHSFLGKVNVHSNKSCMVGLSFADDDEAASFMDSFNKRDSLITVAPPTPVPVKHLEPPKSNMKKSTSKTSMEEKSSSGFSLFGRKPSKKGKIDKSMIGAPTDFQ
jgi:WH1 domain